MNGNETDHIITLTGEIKELTGMVKQNIQAQSVQLTEIFTRLNDLGAHGCALGQEHTRRLDKMETRLVKAVIALIAILLISSGIVGKDLVMAFLKP